jgi:hypothetical protein
MIEFNEAMKKLMTNIKNGLKLYFGSSDFIVLIFNNTIVKVPVPNTTPKYT